MHILIRNLRKRFVSWEHKQNVLSTWTLVWKYIILSFMLFLCQRRIFFAQKRRRTGCFINQHDVCGPNPKEIFLLIWKWDLTLANIYWSTIRSTYLLNRESKVSCLTTNSLPPHITLPRNPRLADIKKNKS